MIALRSRAFSLKYFNVLSEKINMQENYKGQQHLLTTKFLIAQGSKNRNEEHVRRLSSIPSRIMGSSTMKGVLQISDGVLCDISTCPSFPNWKNEGEARGYVRIHTVDFRFASSSYHLPKRTAMMEDHQPSPNSQKNT